MYFCSKNMSCAVCLLTDSILHPDPSPHLATLDLHLVVGGDCVFVGVLVSSPVLIQPSKESIWQGERRPPLATQLSRTNWNLHQKVPMMRPEKDRFRPKRLA